MLAIRDELQAKIDAWHRRRRSTPWDADAYRSFLEEIDYLEPRGPAFRIETENVDPEIATIAGPQLVVPVSNARFALNAANARWGSLYDALYGTDVIPEAGGCERGAAYNPVRGEAVIALATTFLDHAVPLALGSHAWVTSYRVVTDAGRARLDVVLDDGTVTGLADPGQFTGYASAGERKRFSFRNHGLHIEICIDREHPVGRSSAAGVSDVVLESAVTTIQDLEDSVAAVDAADKVQVYRNWLGLMRGTLTATFIKNGRETTRRLAIRPALHPQHRRYAGAAGPEPPAGAKRRAPHDHPGRARSRRVRSLRRDSRCRNHRDLRAVRPAPARRGRQQPDRQHLHRETQDARLTRGRIRRSSVCRCRGHAGASRYTLKIGVMDEERRTSLNLEECIRQVKQRLVFINTGFLDRTGDEIHTSMEAGPMLRKEAIKNEPWLQAYERRNVQIGIRCGLPGRAQIGKGMWPMPEAMRRMLETKQAHPEAGASCAWVPSPIAATLHAMHYHRVDVAQVQSEMSGRDEADLDTMLAPPLADPSMLSPEQVRQELDNNAQGILGYVVRWIDQGVGCSSVPDINGIGLMEDRATLRISSQLIANWLRHGVCTEQQVIDTFKRMAAVVDRQNRHDPRYERMAPGFRGFAFRAACDLVLKGRDQPNGYTEVLLHAYRRRRKAANSGTVTLIPPFVADS